MVMQHSEQDAVDARARASKNPTPHWHPILATVETTPGNWQMVSDSRGPYAVIRLIRISGEAGYRVETWAPAPEGRQLIGYYRTLRAACEAAHRAFIASHGPRGFAPDPWGLIGR
ncbi:hypothetical protein [Diaminobutyricimonas sp. TR449]|uniref:hypothetical protein n=1 Tax=Diaminobutyricimonas sp. TR449 TaxID=2708076 RepID=UPI001424A199|nr:hypothetical protein [Diaminobutyricimonas sp. TR449]